MAPNVSNPSDLFASTSKTVIPDKFSFREATFAEVLEDLTSRFLLNIPPEEARSLERICFQVEQAHWFYEDFIREENPSLPTMPLRKFCATFFRACPMLREWSHAHEEAFEKFMEYKTRVPVCGAIILNAACDKCVLVKGWKSSAGWGFPKGKINDGETEPDCAAREVLEETGFDVANRLNPKNAIRLTIKEQRISLFIIHDVPEDTVFQTRTRKEISKIEWFNLVDLPTWQKNRTVPGKFYLISPFIGPLKGYLQRAETSKSKRKDKAAKLELGNISTPNGRHQEQSSTQTSVSDDAPTTGSSSQSSAVEPVTPSLLDQLFAKLERPPAPAPEKTDVEPAAPPANGVDAHMANLLSKLSNSLETTPTQGHVGKPQRDPITPSPSQSDDSAWPSASDSSSSKASPGSERWGWGLGSTPPPPLHGDSTTRAPVTANGTHAATTVYSTNSSRPSISSTPTRNGSRSNSIDNRMLAHLALLESVADESARASTPTLLPATPSLALYDSQRKGSVSSNHCGPMPATHVPHAAAPASSFGHPFPLQGNNNQHHSPSLNQLSSYNHGLNNNIASLNNSPFVVHRPPPGPRAYSFSGPSMPAPPNSQQVHQQKGHLLSLLSGLQGPPPPATGPQAFPPLTNPRPVHPPIPIAQLQPTPSPAIPANPPPNAFAQFSPRAGHRAPVNPNLLSILNSGPQPLIADATHPVYPTGTPVTRR